MNKYEIRQLKIIKSLASDIQEQLKKIKKLASANKLPAYKYYEIKSILIDTKNQLEL